MVQTKLQLVRSEIKHEDEANKLTGLSSNQISEIRRTPPVNLGLPFEDFEDDVQADSFEPELGEGGNQNNEDEDKDILHGNDLYFTRKFTGMSSASIDNVKIRKLLKKHKDLNEIPLSIRGAVYRYWERKVNEKMREDVIEIIKGYEKCVKDRKVTKVNSGVIFRTPANQPFLVAMRYPHDQPLGDQGHRLHYVS